MHLHENEVDLESVQPLGGRSLQKQLTTPISGLRGDFHLSCCRSTFSLGREVGTAFITIIIIISIIISIIMIIIIINDLFQFGI